MTTAGFTATDNPSQIPVGSAADGCGASGTYSPVRALGAAASPDAATADVGKGVVGRGSEPPADRPLPTFLQRRLEAAADRALAALQAVSPDLLESITYALGAMDRAVLLLEGLDDWDAGEKVRLDLIDAAVDLGLAASLHLAARQARVRGRTVVARWSLVRRADGWTATDQTGIVSGPYPTRREAWGHVWGQR